MTSNQSKAPGTMLQRFGCSLSGLIAIPKIEGWAMQCEVDLRSCNREVGKFRIATARTAACVVSNWKEAE
jgi:hypothetical protein